jgi:hypothetical protein
MRNLLRKRFATRASFLDATGSFPSWAVAQEPRGYIVVAGSYAPYTIVDVDFASVSANSWKREDATNPSGQEFSFFLRSDYHDHSCQIEDSSTSEISDFLNTVYGFAKRGEEDEAIDVILEYINDLLVEGQFDSCDRILDEVDLARIPPVLMVSFLTITAAAKPKLKSRDRFFKVVQRLVAKQRGGKATARLLDGLD